MFPRQEGILPADSLQLRPGCPGYRPILQRLGLQLHNHVSQFLKYHVYVVHVCCKCTPRWFRLRRTC